MLDLELRLIRNVLILAPAAASEIRAGGLHTVRGRSQDAQESGAGEVLFQFGYFRRNLLAWEHKWDEYHKILNPRHTFATKGNIFDTQIYFLSRSQCHRYKLKAVQPAQKNILCRPVHGAGIDVI